MKLGHLLLATTLLASSTAAIAGIGPPIAYVKTGGAWSEIYLLEPNGSSQTKIYRTSKTLGGIDLKPGGGEIAFVEAGLLRVLTFDNAGRTVNLTAPRSFGCGSVAQADGVDFHPNGGPLLVSDACGRLWTMANGSATPQLLLTNSTIITYPRWLPDGSGFVYVDGSPGAAQLWRQTYPLTTGTLLGPLSERPIVNMAHTSNTAIIAKLSGYTLWDLDGNTQTPGCKGGTRNVQYSPNDQQMVYQVRDNKGAFLLLTNSDCTGGVNTLVGRSSMSVAIDWRRE